MNGSRLTYRDFPIEMTGLQPDGTCRVRVIGQTPGGEMSASEAETVQFDPAEFRPFLLQLEYGGISRAALIDFGEKLAGLLLPGRVRNLFLAGQQALGTNEGLRLRLRIEPLPLAALPWEYAHVGRTAGEKLPADFLGLQRRISITRYETVGPPLEPIQGKDTIRIVVALANPITSNPAALPPLNVAADQEAIETAIRLLDEQAPGVESVILERASRAKFLEALPGADIFHFAGHGVFEESELLPDGRFRRRGKILLEGENKTEDPFDSDLLAVNLGNAGVRLAVLGACSTAARDDGGAWTGVAPALVRENIPAVVAMQFKVKDKNAARFMAFLYLRVLAGYSIDEAIFEGRQALFSQPLNDEDQDWGVPVLYLRAADGVLFPLPESDTAGEVADAEAESPVVRIQRRLGVVRGESIGLEVGHILSGQADIQESIDVVERGGRAVGVRIETLGGGRPAARPRRSNPPDEEGS